jgi:hypothetical protein
MPRHREAQKSGSDDCKDHERNDLLHDSPSHSAILAAAEIHLSRAERNQEPVRRLAPSTCKCQTKGIPENRSSMRRLDKSRRAKTVVPGEIGPNECRRVVPETHAAAVAAPEYRPSARSLLANGLRAGLRERSRESPEAQRRKLRSFTIRGESA